MVFLRWLKEGHLRFVELKNLEIKKKELVNMLTQLQLSNWQFSLRKSTKAWSYLKQNSVRILLFTLNFYDLYLPALSAHFLVDVYWEFSFPFSICLFILDVPAQWNIFRLAGMVHSLNLGWGRSQTSASLLNILKTSL